MTKHKTSTLEGALLDQAVALAEGVEQFYTSDCFTCSPSEDWECGGPIIERERISIDFTDKPHKRPNCCATLDSTGDTIGHYGPTPLIAAMRAYCASVLGDEVDLP